MSAEHKMTIDDQMLWDGKSETDLTTKLVQQTLSKHARPDIAYADLMLLQIFISTKIQKKIYET